MSLATFNLSSANTSIFNNSLSCGKGFNPNNKFLDLSRLKEIADDNFDFDENVRNVSKWKENNGRKGEIACNKQFPLFP